MRGMLLLTLCLFLTACGPTTFVVGVTPDDQRLTATIVESSGAWSAPRVAIIDVSGMIYNFNKPGLLSEGDNPVSTLAEKLQAAKEDDRVKAVILRLNSPGGTVTASDAMYREIQRFRKDTGKPVVALMMDVAASGGYYIACASDRIVAYPTTITGSIGVIMQTLSFKPALDYIGIRAETIASGPNKDAGSPLSVLTEGQRKVFQDMIDDFYQRFTHVVRQARTQIPADQFTAVTDGRVVTGTQALKLGLVDELGDLHDAFATAKKLAKLPTADLMLYHRPLKYVGSAYADSSAPMPRTGVGTQINLAQFNLEEGILAGGPGFYYLWDGRGH